MSHFPSGHPISEIALLYSGHFLLRVPGQVSQSLFLLLLATSSRLFLQHSRNLGTANQLSPELHTLFRTCWGFRDHKAYGSWLSAFRSWSVLRWVDFACWPHLSASAGPTPICHTCEGRGKNIAPKFLLYRNRLS